MERELRIAQEAVRAAGDAILKLYATFERIENAPVDISTEADRASQEIILQRLKSEFPADGLCGEEATATASQGAVDAKRLWIVDPIDGTRGFATKNDEFSVMLGLAVEGRVVLGVVLEPVAGRTTWAWSGGGCWVSRSPDAEPVRCRTSDCASLSESTAAMSRSRKEPARRRLLEIFGAKDSVQTYSAGIKLAQVARGEADFYLGDYPTLHDWDVCAGHILVEEAGGRVTDVDGRPLVYGRQPPKQTSGVLATNGRLHDAALAAVAGRPDGMY